MIHIGIRVKMKRDEGNSNKRKKN